MFRKVPFNLLLTFFAVAPAWAFSNADYSGRYVCNVTSNDAVNNLSPEYFTGIMKLNPNGVGGYQLVGALKAASSAINGVTFDDSLPPPANFCLYALDNATSSYSVGLNGGVTENLSWLAVGSNNAACPASFSMNQVSMVAANGRNPITSNNLLSTGAAGQGYCVKAPSQTFSVASYSGRHVCSGGNDFNSITGSVRETPDGAGHYVEGSLFSSAAGFGAKTGTFCHYFLDTANSFYTINSNGTGYETLAWIGDPASDPIFCPSPNATFVDQTAIALGPNNTAEFSSANFLNQNLAGNGECTP